MKRGYVQHFIRSHKNIYSVLIMAIIIVSIVIYIILNIFEWSHNTTILHALKNSQSMTYTQSLKNQEIFKINQLVALPKQVVQEGQIDDVQSLISQDASFKNARNGDILLMYPNMTIIYDPVNKYIVSISMHSLLK